MISLNSVVAIVGLLTMSIAVAKARANSHKPVSLIKGSCPKENQGERDFRENCRWKNTQSCFEVYQSSLKLILKIFFKTNTIEEACYLKKFQVAYALKSTFDGYPTNRNIDELEEYVDAVYRFLDNKVTLSKYNILFNRLDTRFPDFSNRLAVYVHHRCNPPHKR